MESTLTLIYRLVTFKTFCYKLITKNMRFPTLWAQVGFLSINKELVIQNKGNHTR